MARDPIKETPETTNLVATIDLMAAICGAVQAAFAAGLDANAIQLALTRAAELIEE